MDYIGIAERVLTAMRQLLSLVTPQLSSGNGDTFIQKVYRFAQRAISILEQMEQTQKKQWNLLLNYIVSTASLVLQIMSSNVAFDAVTRVSQEVRSMFQGRIPEYIARDYDDLQRNLATASEKLEAIQSACNWLISEVSTLVAIYRLSFNHNCRRSSLDLNFGGLTPVGQWDRIIEKKRTSPKKCAYKLVS